MPMLMAAASHPASQHKQPRTRDCQKLQPLCQRLKTARLRLTTGWRPLPAVPKLPIRLAAVTADGKATSAADAAEPSYADLTAQLAGSSDASSSSGGSGDEGTPSAASENDVDRPRDPRRELALDVAVAEALAQASSVGPTLF